MVVNLEVLQKTGIERRSKAFAVSLFLVCVSISSAGAQTSFNWTNTTEGYFETVSNWNPTGPPGANDDANFLLANTYTVKWDGFTGDRTNRRMTVENGNVSFEGIGTRTYTLGEHALVRNGGQLELGTTVGGVDRPMNLVTGFLYAENNGVIRVTRGSTIAADAVHVSRLGGYGLVNVTGAGSRLDQVTTFGSTIGSDNGSGYLTFQQGAAGSFAGQLTVGYSLFNPSLGIVTVASGADLTLRSVRIVGGANNGQTGRFNIHGAGTTVTQSGNSTLSIGSDLNTTGVLSISESVQSGATYTTGTGDMTIHNTGRVTVGGSTTTGTLNANGNIQMFGGILDVNGSSQFNLAQGRQITASDSAIISFDGSRILAKNNVINLTDGSDLTVGGYLDLGRSTGTGSLLVSGIGTTANIGNYSLLGNGGAGSLNVSGGGVVTYENGLSIRAQGSAVVDAGGELVTNENLFVSGGLDVMSTGTLTLASGKSITGYSDGQITFNGGYTLGGGSSIYLNSGSTFISNAYWGLGGSGGAGTMNVSGSGTMATFNSSGNVGLNGELGELNIEDSATAHFNSTLNLAVSSFSNSQGRATVRSGGTLNVGDLNIGTSGGVGQVGSLTVEGIGSSVIQSALGNTIIGSSVNSVGNLSIQNGGSFFTPGEITLNSTGSVLLDGGYLTVGSINDQGGNFDWQAGSLTFTGDSPIGSNAVFGPALELTGSKRLNVNGTATISPFYQVVLNGGTFSVDDLNVGDGGGIDFRKGNLVFQSPSYQFTLGDTGPLGNQINLGAQQHIQVVDQAVIDGNGRLSIGNDASFSALTLTNSGEIYLDGNNASVITSGSTLINQGTLAGSGRIEGAFINAGIGLVQVDSGRRLSFSDTVYNQTGGRLTGRGTFVAPNIDNSGQMLFSGGFTDVFAGVTNQAGSQFIITGGGTTTVYGGVEIKAGGELRISDFSNGVFFEEVQVRTGALLTGGGNAFFEAGLSIGNSPGRTEFPFNVTLGPTSDLLVEIAGTNPFLPEFDQYVFLQNLTLQGGSLTIDLIGLDMGDPDYMPSLGDSFRIIEVSGLWTGQFGSFNLPELSRGLFWETSDLYSGGIVRVGATAIPEPNACLLGWLMLAAAFGRQKRYSQFRLG